MVDRKRLDSPASYFGARMSPTAHRYRTPGRETTNGANQNQRCPLCCPLIAAGCGKKGRATRQIALSVSELLIWVPHFDVLLVRLISVRSVVQLYPGPFPTRILAAD
jgi:hypothetical protein